MAWWAWATFGVSAALIVAAVLVTRRMWAETDEIIRESEERAHEDETT
ncbi:MAG: hypothetical protein MUQ30_17640 [Anaerolineae bacterium]|nr:hypothetical protein [Anaerolineae bacterium]